jgi:hypothetical protein
MSGQRSYLQEISCVQKLQVIEFVLRDPDVISVTPFEHQICTKSFHYLTIHIILSEHNSVSCVCTSFNNGHNQEQGNNLLLTVQVNGDVW